MKNPAVRMPRVFASAILGLVLGFSGNAAALPAVAPASDISGAAATTPNSQDNQDNQGDQDSLVTQAQFSINLGGVSIGGGSNRRSSNNYSRGHSQSRPKYKPKIRIPKIHIRPPRRHCPRGTYGRYPNCKPKVVRRCPRGTVGHYPNCRPRHVKQCPRGTVGRYPNCRPRYVKKCPRGTVGRYPNCRPRIVLKCPPGTVGRFPNCRPRYVKKCPPGTVGRYPNCRTRVVERCPVGMKGRYPNCYHVAKPRCPKGMKGRYPKCYDIVKPRCPRGTVGRYPDCRTRIVKRCSAGQRGKWPNCYYPRPPKIVQPLPQPEITQPPRVIAKPPRIKRPRIERARVNPLPRPRPVRNARVERPEQRPDELVVVLDQSSDPNVEASVAQQYGLVALNGHTLELIQSRVQRYRIPDNRTVANVLTTLQADGRIASVQPNYLYRFQSGSGDAGMQNAQYAPSMMGLSKAHAIAQGRNITVAVIDSGVDEKHPVLKNGNITTFNAVGDKKPRADAHGTGVVSVVGGQGNLAGIAPAARVLAVRAFFREKRGKAALTTSMILLKSIDWAHKNKARVFNLSFAGPKDPAVERMLKAAHEKGAIIVAAAGNKGPKAPAAYPAAYEHVLAVTATDDRDRLYKKANRGKHIELAAPGVDIFIAVPGGGYDFKSGTSFAAPHITGLVALMLERNPALTSKQIRGLLEKSALDLGAPGHDALFGAGRADALAALQAVNNGTESAKVADKVVGKVLGASHTKQ